MVRAHRVCLGVSIALINKNSSQIADKLSLLMLANCLCLKMDYLESNSETGAGNTGIINDNVLLAYC